MIGAQTLHATGYAMGVQRDGAVGTGDPDRDTAVIAYFGDGASSQGDVNEAFVYAAVFNAPVVFFCQNNQWAISEPIERQSRIPLYQRSLGFGFPGLRVDGNDVLAVHAVTQAALQRAREGSGPDPDRGLHLPDGRAYDDRRPDPLPACRRSWRAWKLKDPIARVKAYLTRERRWSTPTSSTRSRTRRRSSASTCEKVAAPCPSPTSWTSSTRCTSSKTPELAAQQDELAGLPCVVRGSALMTTITLAKGLNAGLRARWRPIRRSS